MKSNYKLLNSIYLLFKSLDRKRRTQFFGIVFLNIFNGLFEFITIGSALLFIEALTNPDKISSSFSFLISILNTNSEKDFIRTSTILFLVIIFVTTIIRIFNLWLNTKFRISFLNYISNKVYRKILNQEYYFFIDNNSSELLTDLTSNIEKTNFFFENFLTLTTSLILSLSITFSLINLNFYITFFSVILFSIIYFLLGIIINRRVDNYSKLELRSSYELIKVIQNSLNAIKEIIISNNHEFYFKFFKKNNLNLRRYQGIIGFITTFPRYLFEGVGLFFLGLAGYIIYSNLDNSTNIIALLGAFALGAQKLLPSMQSTYKSWSLLYFYNEPLDRVLDLIRLNSNENRSIKSKLSFRNKIKIENLSFSYKNNKEIISKNINLTIKKGENLGIFGRTGSGKTTLVNILMGIFVPSRGNIFIDELELFNQDKTDLLKKWKNNISLVPQDVYLYDASILENIAFCIPKEKINFKKVKDSAKMACAHEFISKTKDGYQTVIGDKGMKLSGGQKQRIGLARAIYNESELLILDESTSALDFKTEKSVIESIFNKNYNPNLTTITIAHRLSTLRYCDKIIELKDGSINGIYNNKEYIEKFKNLF